MTPPTKQQDEDLLLQTIKEILLREENKRIEILEEEVQAPAIREKVLPLLEEQLRLFEKKFPKEYEIVVNKLIEEKIKNSQEMIVNALYPSLGKMIKKYVNFQVQSMKDSIDERVNNSFTPKAMFGKVKHYFFGIKESDVIFTESIDYQIEEVYLIQKNSGLLIGSASEDLLIGHASKENTVDKDVIAGMLTAIIAFVEDAFKREQEDLESIQYGTYKIIIQSFYSYYIALAVKGTLSAAQRDQLGNKILDFADQHLKEIGLEIADQDKDKFSEFLKLEFLE